MTQTPSRFFTENRRNLLVSMVEERFEAGDAGREKFRHSWKTIVAADKVGNTNAARGEFARAYDALKLLPTLAARQAQAGRETAKVIPPHPVRGTAPANHRTPGT